MEEIKAAFRKRDEFRDLDDNTLEALAAVSAVEEFGEGDAILAQGVKGESVWLVLDGSVKVIQRRHSGEKVLLAVLGPGEIFGEISVLTNSPTTAEIVAKEKCRAARIPGNVLSDLTKDSITTMAKFAKSVVYRLSGSKKK